jgi:hypothetical protein
VPKPILVRLATMACVIILEISRCKDSSRQSQLLYVVRFYCNMFRLIYKEPSSGRQGTKEKFVT